MEGEALVDLGPVKSFTVRRQEIYYCRKPEQIKLHFPVDIQEYKETTVKYGTFGLV